VPFLVAPAAASLQARASVVDDVAMAVRGPGRRTAFYLWALVTCPAIGIWVAEVADTHSYARLFAPILGLPAGLAVAGGLASRPGYGWVISGVALAPVIGYLVFLVRLMDYSAN
jgi:hypothetical protein